MISTTTIFFVFLSFNFMEQLLTHAQANLRTDVKLPQDSLVAPPSSSTASSVEDSELTRYFDFLNGVRPLDKNTCPSGESCYGCEYCSDGSLCADCNPDKNNVRVVPDFLDEVNVSNSTLTSKTVYKLNPDNIVGVCDSGEKCSGCSYCQDGKLCNACQAEDTIIRILPEASHDLDQAIHLEQEEKFYQVYPNTNLNDILNPSTSTVDSANFIYQDPILAAPGKATCPDRVSECSGCTYCSDGSLCPDCEKSNNCENTLLC